MISRPGRTAARRAVYRRRRLATAGVLATVVVVIVLVVAPGGGPSRRSGRGGSAPAVAGQSAARPAAGAGKGIPAVEAGLLPWELPAPLSRMTVLPGPGSDMLVAGGLSAGQSSAAGVYTVDTATGSASRAGDLATPVHDGAGAVIGGRNLIFGGGAPATVATVQSFANGSGALTGRLPSPRSDLAAVTAGATTYIVGGFNGSQPSSAVLATTDGRTFRTVANLAVPVRYPAVAAAGKYIYVFGGETIGPGAATTATIQRVEPSRGLASVVGHLPAPLEGATAATLAGHIYLAGGDTPASSAAAAAGGVASGAGGVAPGVAGGRAPGGAGGGAPGGAGGVVPGMGTTQLDGWATATTSSSPGVAPSGAVWSYDPATGRLLGAGRLQVPVSHAGAAVVGGKLWLVGGESGASTLATVQVVSVNRSFGVAGQPGAGSPYYGYNLLIADRGNDRLLLMDPAMQRLWTYPSATSPADALGFYFPDDAFFANHGTAIVSNQEQNETIVEIGYPSGSIIWSYGHPKQAGTATGYLHEPDDAYLLRNGQITVADADNCRVLVINHDGTVASQIGTDGSCYHNPPASMGSPNGDTPLWDGNLLISEINGSWVSEYTPAGQHVWSVQLPISYPSDPQQVGASPTDNADRYLIADYASPGQVLQFTREGQILSRYVVTSGPGALDHPSLAEELPNGIYMINDDYNHRMVAIDPATGALVWQYGVTGQPGSTGAMLNTPDGFDLLGPGGTTPTHPQTG